MGEVVLSWLHWLYYGKCGVSYPGPNQAPDKVVVYFPDLKLLYGSCMILGRPPWEHGGGGHEAVADSSPQAWAIPGDPVVPGDGERLDRGLIQHTLDLLEK